MKQIAIRKLVLSALFLALGITLPFLTGQIPQIGRALLPMHIPVFFCGLICGWPYGLSVGLILPFLRSVLFGMPPFPIATAMAFEMAVYGLVCGLIYTRKQNLPTLYLAMVLSMITGRIAWGLATWIIMTMDGGSFTWQLFLSGAFLEAIPGIIVQLTLIPLLMAGLQRAKLIPLRG